jgi:hypothetical protein
MIDPAEDTLRAAVQAVQIVPDVAARQAARAVLMAAFDAQWAVVRRAPPPRLAWAWAIVRLQARLVHSAIWLGSALIIALGALVTLAFTTPGGGLVPLALIAPLAAALGSALLYGEDADPPQELLLAAPAPRAAVLLARLVLLFGFNLAAALAASIVLALLNPALALWPLIAGWLAPMTVLAALGFLSSVICNDSGMSALAGFIIWGGLVLRHVSGESLPPFLDWLPDLWRMGLLGALVTGGLAAAAGIWLSSRDMRWAQEAA